MAQETVPPLLQLPAELLQHILCFLDPFSLAKVAQTCKTLGTQSYDDLIWQPHVNDNVSMPITEPKPLKSFRDLYIAHHPYWFLPRQQIWFADTFPTGKLIIARYEPQEGSIVAYAVVAHRRTYALQRWEKDRNVIIHSFAPEVELELKRPVLKLSAASAETDDQPGNYPSDRGYGPPSKYNKELVMDLFTESGLFSSFILCRPLPDAAISAGTQVWPPLRFPATARARNSSQDAYGSSGHRPSVLSEVSESNFRLRKWVEYNSRHSGPRLLSWSSPNGLAAVLGLTGPRFSTTLSANGDGSMSVQMPEDISTYATLLGSCYTPTSEKPWQGIYCGDYSGHGCEFILVRQISHDEAGPLPEGMEPLESYFEGDDTDTPSDPDHKDDWAPQSVMSEGSNAPAGRLEAIKLTGDINIPRGEHTFIAPDISNHGLIRIADEEVFRGARVVRSAGHIAHQGFQDGRYIQSSGFDSMLTTLSIDAWMPSQLVMVSHDTLCQYWTDFGHMSYYRRVDLNALLNFSAPSDVEV